MVLVLIVINVSNNVHPFLENKTDESIMYKFLILLTFLLVIVILMGKSKFNEPFTNNSIRDRMSWGRHHHVVVADDGHLKYSSFQQPSGDGIYGCTQISCPPNVNHYSCKYSNNDRMICWSCD